jgi:DNA-binding transcriptional regulator YdaS (Cro superfamily)
MTLKDWLKKGLTREGLAELEASISLAYVWKVARGKATPSPKVAAEISAATSGEVTIAELLYPEGLPSGARMV